MASFVLDTSVALQWVFADEVGREYGLSILAAINEDFLPVVPCLWFYEVSNTIVSQVKRTRISAEQAQQYLDILSAMPIQMDPPDARRILRLDNIARAHNLTSYDAAFLELAMRLRLPLATRDKALRNAAERVGVELLAAQQAIVSD